MSTISKQVRVRISIFFSVILLSSALFSYHGSPAPGKPSSQSSSTHAGSIDSTMSRQPPLRLQQIPLLDRLDANDNYLFVPPKGSFSTQLSVIFKMAALASAMNRTMILGPIISPHGSQSWSAYFDIVSFLAATSTRAVELASVRHRTYSTDTTPGGEYLSCHPTKATTKDATTRTFEKNWEFHILPVYQQIDGDLTRVTDYFIACEEQMLVLCDTDGVEVSDEYLWNLWGRHLEFASRVIDTADIYIASQFGTNKAFIGVIPLQPMHLEQVEILTTRISLKSRGGRSGVDLPVFVSLGDDGELIETVESFVDQKGWKTIRGVEMDIERTLGILGRPILDALIVSRAMTIIGDHESIAAKAASWRALWWYGSPTQWLMDS